VDNHFGEQVKWNETLTAPDFKHMTEPDYLPGSPIRPESEPTTFTLRGNTIIGLSRPIGGGPMFQKRAERFAGSVAPMREVMRFVTDSIIKW
jgi:hypothetical protein